MEERKKEERGMRTEERQNVFSIECVLYRMCSLQNVCMKEERGMRKEGRVVKTLVVSSKDTSSKDTSSKETEE